MCAAHSSLPRVYLAGPDVFFPEALNIARKRKDFIAGLEMEGVFPLDPQDEAESNSKSARSIFKMNCALIDSCQALLANVTPFRGPSADVGTAWEIGYACGQGKPVVAYSEDLSVYRDKVFRGGWSGAPDETLDRHGNEIEDFGGIDNLMLTHSVIAICATFEQAATTLKRSLNEISERKH
jgi:nucleoside 2-deoxyribosyltransferase